MPDYTSIDYWINQLAAREMDSLGETEINLNHMALAVCSLRHATELSPRGTNLEPMTRQSQRVANAFAALNSTPEMLYNRLKPSLHRGNALPKAGGARMVMFAEGVGSLSPRAYELAKPALREGSHFLIAILEKPSPELTTALASLKLQATELIQSLKTAPDTPPKLASPPKALNQLPLLGQTTSRRSTIVISPDAKWKKVTITGWHFDFGQNEALALCLTPQRTPSDSHISGFENPVEGGGGLGLEVHLDELADLKGDHQTLLITSRSAVSNCSVLIEAMPDSSPAISKSYKITAVAGGVKLLRLRIAAESEPSRGLRKLFSLSRSKEESALSAEDGDVVSIPAGASLTAEDDADIGVPVAAVAGAKNIGSAIICDFPPKMWSYEGKGHPSLGVLIWVALPARKSLRLQKPSQVVIGHPSGRLGRQMSISPTDVVEEHHGPLPNLRH